LLSGLERKLKSVTEALEKLSAEGEKGTPIVVEGRNDLLALRKLGVNGKILCVKASRKTLIDLLDTVQADELIVFVDFDRDGRQLVGRITSYLETRGVKVNLGYWKEISALVRHDVKDIEGLPSYLEKLKKPMQQFLLES